MALGTGICHRLGPVSLENLRKTPVDHCFLALLMGSGTVYLCLVHVVILSTNVFLWLPGQKCRECFQYWLSGGLLWYLCWNLWMHLGHQLWRGWVLRFDSELPNCGDLWRLHHCHCPLLQLWAGWWWCCYRWLFNVHIKAKVKIPLYIIVLFCIGLPILDQKSVIVSSTTTLAIPCPDGYSRWQKEGSSKRLFLFREKEEGLLLLLEQWWEFWVLPDSIFFGWRQAAAPPPLPPTQFWVLGEFKKSHGSPTTTPSGRERSKNENYSWESSRHQPWWFFLPFLLSKKYHSRHFIRTHLPLPNIILLLTTEYLALNEAAKFSYFPPLSISIHLRASISFPFGAKQKSGASLFIFIFLKSHLWLFRLHVGKYFPTYTFLRDAKRISNFDFPFFPPFGESPSLFSLLCPYCMASFPVYTIRKGFFFFLPPPIIRLEKKELGRHKAM